MASFSFATTREFSGYFVTMYIMLYIHICLCKLGIYDTRLTRQQFGVVGTEG